MSNAELLSQAFDALPDAVCILDEQFRFVYLNALGEEMLRMAGIEPSSVMGACVLDALPHARAGEWQRALEDAERTRQPSTFERHSPAIHRWVETRIVPQGRYFVTITRDIDLRHARERETAILAEAGRVLAHSLDYRTTLQAVANLVTPALADWCGVEVITPEGKFEVLAVAHANPDKVKWAIEFNRRYPTNPDAPTGVANVVRTGKSELYADITEEMITSAALDPDHLRLIRELQMHSVLIVPMSAHGRTVGAITLIGAESGRHYSAQDIPLIEEIARRSAIAIENAELFHAAASGNRAKSEFLASMSHELRTPLNAIIGYAELLNEGITGPVSEPQKEQLTRIRASAAHLLGLIDEVLTYARIEAGQEQVITQDVSLAAVVEQAVSLVKPMAQAKDIPIVTSVDDLHATCTTDVLKLRQILVNLLTNAVKFTDAGEISVSAKCDDADCFFVVRDTGIGIGQSYLDRVFDPFWQMEQTATRRVGGTGLGLSVTRRLATLLGGTVTVESVTGAGSTFTVRLPRVPAPTA